MRVAVVTDSNSGITQKEAKEEGVYVIPMPFMIQEETYFEDINLTQKDFFDRMDEDADISTSQPSPDTIMKLWDELLQSYDQIVHIPMSSGLSGSYQTAAILADDYEEKVAVVNNQRISVTQRQSVSDAVKLSESGKNAFEIKKILEDTKFDSSIYIMLDTLKYLKKGGRITPAAAALGTLLRLKPVLQIHGEKLDAYSKARTIKQAKSVMISAIQKDLDNMLQDPECRNTYLQIAHTNNAEAAEEFRKEVAEAFPNADTIVINDLSLSVACHIGPGSLALACTKKLEM